MKISISKIGWEAYKYSKADLKGWLRDMLSFRGASKQEAWESIYTTQQDNPKTLDKPKRFKITLTYEEI